MTTHSPQIVERFQKGRVLRLSSGGNGMTGSHASGCSAEVDAALTGMGYRLSVISSEVFFSRVFFSLKVRLSGFSTLHWRRL